MIYEILALALKLSFWGVLGSIFLFFFVRTLIRSTLERNTTSVKRLAFFHPYCNSGGGGEKVLFTMISGLMQAKNPAKPLEIAIYTGDLNPESEILEKVARNFGLKIEPNVIKFIRVPYRAQCLDPKPSLTMIRQILGSMFYTYKAIKLYVPDLFFDTTGFAFSHWVVKQLVPESKVLTYVHYPFISYDMLDCVVKKEKKFNNNERIADSRFLSRVKVWYYRILIYLYGNMGNYVDLVFTNSSWTDTHIRSLWWRWRTDSILLYPPCNIEQFTKLKAEGRKPTIVSFAQFRPEKDHALQLEVFKRVRERVPGINPRLVVCGSCRDKSDEKLLESLKKRAEEMEISKSVTFLQNLKFEELLQVFSEASIGIHTMKAEHFGIAVVELISAGLIVIAHNSAGPKYDIIKERNDNFGFLCQDAEDYVNSIEFVLKMKEEKRVEMVSKGRKEMERFQTKSFIRTFLEQFYENKRIW